MPSSLPREAVAEAYGGLALRLALGAMWIAHALFKVVVFSIDGFALWLDSLGLPGFMAGPVVLMEIAGGTAILLGFHGRHVSLALIPVLTVAAWTHLPNGWVFSNPGGGWEFPVFLIAVSIAHGLIGDGALALRRSPLLFGMRAADAT
jgi:putative oxidoreductase